MVLIVEMWARPCHYAVCEACETSADRTSRIRRALMTREAAHIVVRTN